MPSTRRVFLRAVGRTVGTALGIGLAGCTSADGGGDVSPMIDTPATPAPTLTPARTSTGTPRSGIAGATVSMTSEAGTSFFDPIGLYVEPGDVVTWEIESDAHSTTAYAEDHFMAAVTRIPEGAEGWDSGTLRGTGETFTHKFETRGTYDYFCIPHKPFGMVGRIVVGQPGGPADGSMPPDGPVPTGEAIVEAGAIPYPAFDG